MNLVLSFLLRVLTLTYTSPVTHKSDNHFLFATLADVWLFSIPIFISIFELFHKIMAFSLRVWLLIDRHLVSVSFK